MSIQNSLNELSQMSIAALMGLNDSHLKNSRTSNLQHTGSECLITASQNYWGYRIANTRFEEECQQFKKFLVPNHSFKNMFGIEIETENVHYKHDNDVAPIGWANKGDGSLRNGMEFVSFPASLEETFALITSLYFFFGKQLRSKPDFSWRTSVHVHVNIRPFTVEEIANLIMLYSIFEPLLFSFVGNSRDGSNFCVPLTQSAYPKRLRLLLPQALNASPDSLHMIRGMLLDWDKYCALNFSRIGDLGTVEFRHMAGTWDTEKIGIWVALLDALVGASKRIPQHEIIANIARLNSLSNYAEFKRLVFGNGLSQHLGEPTNFISLLSGGVSFAKEWLISPSKITKANIKNSPAEEWITRMVDHAKKIGIKDEPSSGRLKKLLLNPATDSMWSTVTIPAGSVIFGTNVTAAPQAHAPIMPPVSSVFVPMYGEDDPLDPGGNHN